MSHKNFFLDFTVGTFVIHKEKCLMCFHRNMKMWLPVGGHIDENEVPDKAAVREAKEEAGIDVKLIGLTAGIENKSVQSLTTPIFVDRHFVRGEHWHCGLFYAAIPIDDDPKIILDESEHEALDWFSIEEIEKLDPILPTIKYYAKYSIHLVANYQKSGKLILT